MQTPHSHKAPVTAGVYPRATPTALDLSELFTRPDNAPYTRTEAAAYLGLAVNTLKYQAYTGTGPAYHKLGRKVIYTRADLDAYREAGRVTASQAGA